MKPITDQERQEMIDWIPEHIEHLKSTNSKSTYARLNIAGLEIALASLTTEPEMYANCIEVCDSYGPEIERRVYPDLLSAMKSKDDHGGVVLELFISPPVPVIKLPDDHKIDGVGSLAYASGYEDGHKEAIELVKRLNGIK